MRLAASTVLVALLLAGCLGEVVFAGPGATAANDAVRLDSPAPRPGLHVETDLGDIVFILYPAAAPYTVAHVLALADAGFYDGLLWHRVVDDFVIQTGDPSRSGLLRDMRTVPVEPHAEHFFSAGAVGLARSVNSDSGSSQFFITEFPQPHLKEPREGTGQVFGRYTMFGQVVEGMDVVRAIAAVPTIPGLDRPVDDVHVVRARSIELILDAALDDSLPLRTSAKVTAGPWQVTLETPRRLVEGAEATLSFYMQGSAPPPADPHVVLRQGREGEAFPLTPHADDARVLTARVPLPGAGIYKAVLLSGGSDVVGFDVRVNAR